MANISQKWLNIMGNDLEIMAIFSMNYNKKYHASEIARISKIPQRTSLRKLDNLCKIGVLRYERAGKNKIYFVNFDYVSIKQFMTFIESYKTIRFFSENPKIGILLKDLNCSAVIFGSYAKNSKNHGSDIDILFLCRENKKIKEIIKNSPVEIHAQFSTIEDFSKKLQEKNALALEIAENHVIINNFEDIANILIDYGK